MQARLGKSSFLGIVGCALAVCILSACSDSSGSSGSALDWQPCDESIVSARVAAELGGRVGCAVMQVPLDHDDPKKGMIDFALLRVAAGDPAQRRGAIFMNPGGPGGDGLSLGLHLGRLFASSDPSTAIGGKFRQLSDRYDVVGFSPRGVGSSTNLRCETDATYRVELLATTDGSPSNLDNIFRNQQLDAIACRANPLTPYINTDATARDMDLAREAMGDQQLNYFGYSYGTWLGVWYASVFPEYVGRMVLDSSVDFSVASITEVTFSQSVPLQFVFDQILIPFAAEEFELGTLDQIRAIFGSLPVELQTVLSDELYQLLFNQDSATEAIAELGAAKGVGEILRDRPGASDAELLAAVESYEYAFDPEIDEMMSDAAVPLMQGYLDLMHGVAKPVLLPVMESVNKSVVCNDGPSPTDPVYWNLPLETLRFTAPAYFHDRFELNCTRDWGGPTVVKPDVSEARRVPNILMLQDQFDPATPLPGALRTYALLGNASLIYQSRSYSHGVFPADSACVDLPVTDFFLSVDVPPQFVTQCVGQGLLEPSLPGDREATAAAAAGAEGLPPELRALVQSGMAGRTSDGFADPEEAREAMRDIRALVLEARVRR